MAEHHKTEFDVTFFTSSKNLQKNNPEAEKIEVQLQDLIKRIEDEITCCQKQKEEHPRLQHYSDLLPVLNATRNYLCGNIGLNILEEYMQVYSKWNKPLGFTNTEALISEAIAFKDCSDQSSSLKLK
ncbi:hypothetical protein OQJ18_10510 [Fluoribacter dumoffii]|uniref:Uncharacterized protein n=1 Tax=Fluoribacter dumoffii TaxID=463 RepID=A0A377G7K8_9GAMM|nr:hypothetical protein [Fluoribacter dumoffii]KTC92450.1 hypothetical protein Ldum_0256 [Fluoribacter dumoffii NY 23]MCW8387026.1 hypothetical protein [Fluoribacter dumoffii]MCW8417470.1 hypothetical protein [Fluoribacter dumoffii]MCW8454688.1 hypothetical protein [Fluoribacter dumoffii]MCW8461234.1 hypothetical protein [Fluoribacter dumoffii]